MKHAEHAKYFVALFLLLTLFGSATQAVGEVYFLDDCRATCSVAVVGEEEKDSLEIHFRNNKNQVDIRVGSTDLTSVKPGEAPVMMEGMFDILKNFLISFLLSSIFLRILENPPV